MQLNVKVVIGILFGSRGKFFFADRHGQIDFIPPNCGLKNGLSVISVIIQHRLYVGFEMVHVLLSCEKGAISSEIDLFEKCVISRLLAGVVMQFAVSFREVRLAFPVVLNSKYNFTKLRSR